MDRLQHYTQQFSPPLHVQTLNRWQKEENSIRTTRHILQTQSVVRWPEEMTCNLRWHAATVVVLLLLGAAAQRPHTPAVSGRLPPHHSTTAVTALCAAVAAAVSNLLRNDIRSYCLQSASPRPRTIQAAPRNHLTALQHTSTLHSLDTLSIISDWLTWWWNQFCVGRAGRGRGQGRCWIWSENSRAVTRVTHTLAPLQPAPANSLGAAHWPLQHRVSLLPFIIFKEYC